MSIPARIGRYELLVPIGSGGMATVYVATAHGGGGFSRNIAIKLLHAAVRDGADVVPALLDEAKLAARIHHPNVVAVLDAGDDPSGPFLAMEYVEGDSLARLLEDTRGTGGIPLRFVFKILEDALAGLHAAHELTDENGANLGVVHRDFSPQNILVGVDGVARLADFGIAKAKGSVARTAPGTVKGKLGYMSPEQRRGRPLDRRSDVWAAGVVAWEAIARRPLFGDALDEAAATRAVTQPPPRLRDVRPDVPQALDDAVASALTVEAVDRCPTAAELSRRLAAAARELGGAVTAAELADFVHQLVGERLAERARAIEDVRADRQNAGDAEIDGPPMESEIRRRYRIVRRIGRGGMGTVYEAEHLATHRRVALKVLSDSTGRDHPSLMARFEREARAAGAITSRHIVQVFDAGTDPVTRTPFIAMELLDGEDLAALERRLRPVPPDLALRITAQTCMALAKAHAAGIVHRDVKLSNIFLAEEDTDRVVVKVLDFGIAKDIGGGGAVGTAHDVTSTGSLVGSPHYMSPEQALGKKDLDGRSDVYSLGVVLYVLLSGRLPHADASAIGEIIVAICSRPAPPVTDYAPWVSQEIAHILEVALRIDRTKRFESADAMLEAVRRVLPGSVDIERSMLVSHVSLASPPAGAGSGAHSLIAEVAPRTTPARRKAGLVVGAVAAAGIALGAIGLGTSAPRPPLPAAGDAPDARVAIAPPAVVSTPAVASTADVPAATSASAASAPPASAAPPPHPSSSAPSRATPKKTPVASPSDSSWLDRR